MDPPPPTQAPHWTRFDLRRAPPLLARRCATCPARPLQGCAKGSVVLCPACAQELQALVPAAGEDTP